MAEFRLMTKEEMKLWYIKGQLPCGHGNRYIPGPRGGISQNVSCPTCNLKLNVIDLDSQWANAKGEPWFGQVLWTPSNYSPPEPKPTFVQATKAWLGAVVGRVMHVINWD